MTKQDLKTLARLRREADLKAGIFHRGGSFGGTKRDKSRRTRRNNKKLCREV